MKFITLRNIAATVALSTAAVTVHAEKSGIADFGAFVPAVGKEYVEVNLKPALIKFAAKIVAIDEPEAAELLRSIDGVRVHVVGMDESNRGATTKRMNEIRAELAGSGWEKVVTVKETGDEKGDDVAIFVKTTAEDTIAGVVVTVLSTDGEAVFVNVIGNIKAEQIATVAAKLNIKPLRDLKVRTGGKADEPV